MMISSVLLLGPQDCAVRKNIWVFLTAKTSCLATRSYAVKTFRQARV